MINSERKMRKVFVTFPTDQGEQQERLWAQEVSGDTARIASSPFCTDEVGLDDPVHVSPSGKVLEVLKRGTRTRHARYEAANDQEEAQRQWEMIQQHLARRNVGCESAYAGLFSMCVPLDLDEDGLREQIAQCKVSLVLIEPKEAVTLLHEHVKRLHTAQRLPKLVAGKCVPLA
jgi:hypothetical protein